MKVSATVTVSMRLGLLAMMVLLAGCSTHRAHQNCCVREPGQVAPSLAGWKSGDFTHGAITHAYYVKSPGTNAPPVIVFHEITGMSPPFLKLCDRLVEEGFTVYAPLFFGKPGNVDMRYVSRVLTSDNWSVWKPDVTCEELKWSAALAKKIADDHHGQPVGAIGNCLTGHFPLLLLCESQVKAAVLSQPSLPVSNYLLNRAKQTARKQATGLSPDDWRRVRATVEANKIPVLGLRFELDTLSPQERFFSYQIGLGHCFTNSTITSQNYGGMPEDAHSVLTSAHLLEPIENPCRDKLKEVIEYLRKRLIIPIAVTNPSPTSAQSSL